LVEPVAMCMRSSVVSRGLHCVRMGQHRHLAGDVP
jgi:hypothetical protein